MKIGIYSGSRGGGYGGAENTLGVLAEALVEHGRVEVVTSRTDFSVERLAQYSGTKLDGVRMREVDFAPSKVPKPRNPLARYREARNLNSNVSGEYDLFLSVANIVPPFCHAPFGVLRIFFPFDGRRSKPSGFQGVGAVRDLWHRTYHTWEWDQRFATYQRKVANSHFTARCTKRFWGVDCDVIHPPVDVDFAPAEKANLIVSVGRFVVWGNNKKQLEMMRAFERMTAVHRAGWEYRTVGGLSDLAKDEQYFEQVTRAAGLAPAQALPNLKRTELKHLLEHAKIFWHAAGLGEDEEKDPGRAEHFGQSTVEAMAAGCVPVVINRGGQPEIVEHGVSGFLWDTVEQLEHYTRLLVEDEPLRGKMAAAARERSHQFDRATFARNFVEYLRPALEGGR